MLPLPDDRNTGTKLGGFLWMDGVWPHFLFRVQQKKESAGHTPRLKRHRDPAHFFDTN
jgi:hypothetical protein